MRRRTILRSTNLRAKIYALLALVIALWIFAAWVTTSAGLNLTFVQALNNNVFVPSKPLLLELQQERRLTLEYLGSPTAEQRASLDAERQKITGLADVFKRSAQSSLTNFAASGDLRQRISQTTAALDRLATTRAAVAAQNIDRATAATAFTAAIDSIFQVYDTLGNLDDKQIAHDTAALIQLQRTRELLSQEDALLSGVIAAGRITSGELSQYAQLVGAQRILGDQAAAAVSPADRVRYEGANSRNANLRALEDRVIQTARPGAKVPTDQNEWRAAADPALAGLLDVVLAGGDAIVRRATPVAIWVMVRVVVAAGLGLLAVVAAFIVSISTLRSLVAQLQRLRNAARALAEERLPGLVVRLGRGEKVDVAAEAPPLDFGDDEIGQVGHAFNAVQETAIRTAVQQAELRQGVRDVFLSLARRSQALVHRQLQLLDAMERQETDADELDDLFRVDHLATRMRRNAENLIVLSGAVAGRGWRNPVPIVDVIRGALAEVEDYARVTVLPVESAALAGRAVGDVIHLLAELIENAVSFSPPYTTVQVGGSPVANGFVVEIEDRGLGMSESDLSVANEQLANPPDFNLSSTAQLGLYVVGRLAQRHGIKVKLRESPYGGTTAIVLLPSTLVVDPHDASVRSRREGRLTVRTGPQTGEGGERTAVRQPGRTAIGASPGRDVQPEDGAPATAVVADGPDQAGTAIVGQSPAPWRAVARHAAPFEPHTLPATGPDPNPTAVPTPEPPPAWPPRTMADATAAAPAPPERTPDAGTDEPTIYTAAGLPWRRRQASLTAPLRDESPAAEPADGDRPETPARQPEEIRRIMSSYQTGTLRGRMDADRPGTDGPGADGVAPPPLTAPEAAIPKAPPVPPDTRANGPSSTGQQS
jgi:signal transduction histidine kinase